MQVNSQKNPKTVFWAHIWKSKLYIIVFILPFQSLVVSVLFFPSCIYLCTKQQPSSQIKPQLSSLYCMLLANRLWVSSFQAYFTSYPSELEMSFQFFIFHFLVLPKPNSSGLPTSSIDLSMVLARIQGAHLVLEHPTFSDLFHTKSLNIVISSILSTSVHFQLAWSILHSYCDSCCFPTILSKMLRSLCHFFHYWWLILSHFKRFHRIDADLF